MKSKSLELLRELALVDSRIKHPTLPESARYIKPYRDDTANHLTKAIIDLLRFSGHQAERISTTGRIIDQRQYVTDVVGHMKQIGRVKWIPTSGTRGSADISATICGRSIKIEIKVGKDRQSEAQKAYQEAVEKAGGIYLLVHSFDEFLNYYNQLT